MGSKTRKRNQMRKELTIIAAAILIIAGGLYAYVAFASRDEFVRAHFVRTDGSSSSSFNLEIAATPETRRRGLMFRTNANFPADRGMIFIFPRQEIQTFWMKNTLIPLDMIFIDREMSVVGVVHGAAPRSEQSRYVGKPSTFVVELHGGTAKRENIEAGAKLSLAGQLPEPQ